jgi:hypothetical protein
MMGTGHRLVAASVTLAAGTWLDVQPVPALVAAALAVPFSAGRWSPDADHTWLALCGHRRAVHGWWWPALAGWLVWHFSAGTAPFIVYGPILGWASHLFPADWVFGKGGRDIPKGLPVLPFLPWRTGLGLRVTGKTRGSHSILESLATAGVALTLTLQVWSLVG